MQVKKGYSLHLFYWKIHKETLHKHCSKRSQQQRKPEENARKLWKARRREIYGEMGARVCPQPADQPTGAPRGIAQITTAGHFFHGATHA